MTRRSLTARETADLSCASAKAKIATYTATTARQDRNRLVRDLASSGVPHRVLGRQLGVNHSAVRRMIDSANDQGYA